MWLAFVTYYFRFLQSRAPIVLLRIYFKPGGFYFIKSELHWCNSSIILHTLSYENTKNKKISGPRASCYSCFKLCLKMLRFFEFCNIGWFFRTVFQIWGPDWKLSFDIGWKKYIYIFSESLFALNHSCMFSSSRFAVWKRVLWFLWDKNIFISSANIMKVSPIRSFW